MSTIHNWKFTNHDKNSCSWETVSQSEELLGKSKETFKSKIDAIDNANLVGFNGFFSDTLQWTIFEEIDGWHWKAEKKQNGTLIAVSHVPFVNVKDAFENAFLYGCPKEYVTSQGVSYNMAKSADVGVSVFSQSVEVKNTDSEVKTNNHQFNQTIETKPTYKFDSNKVEVIDDQNENIFWTWLLPLLILLGLLLWWLPSVLGKKSETPQVDSNNISSTIKGTDIISALKTLNSSNLNTAVELAGIAETVNKAGSSYLLAPTNEAFAKLPAGTLGNLLKPENKLQLINLLKSHLIPGKFDLETLKKQTIITNASDQTWSVKFENEKLMINGVEVDTQVDATTGDISVLQIPAVLLPINTNMQPDNSTMASSSNSSSVTSMSITAEIPKVMSNKTVELLEKQGNFTILLKALELSDLKSAFANDNEFTILAPSDEAFGKLPTGILESLAKPENKTKLQNILKYHLVQGKKTFTDFQNNQTVETLNGQPVTLTLDGNGIGQIKGVNNTAQAPIPDIIDGNIILHVLPNEILLPN